MNEEIKEMFEKIKPNLAKVIEEGLQADMNVPIAETIVNKETANHKCERRFARAFPFKKQKENLNEN